MYTLLLVQLYVSVCMIEIGKRSMYEYLYRGRDAYSQRDVFHRAHHVEVDSQYIHMYV